LQITPYGQLTYLRTYQGTLKKGDELLISGTRKPIRVGRIVKLHADEMEDVEGCGPGDIVALFGVDCHSGDTLTSPEVSYRLSSIYVPEPVVSLSIKGKDQKSQEALWKALNRFTKEDPTFRSHVDQDTKETIISGMGELHLEIYVERIKREYNAQIVTGYPQVSYRETISRRASFDYTHKKQTGGAGQYGRVIGYIEPSEEEPFSFQNQVKGGNIPAEFIPAVEKGFRSCLEKGLLLGFPVTGLKVVLQDGQAHSVDSSDLAFMQAAIGAFKQAYLKAGPLVLEPIMKVTVESPREFGGPIMGSVNQRRGLIISASDNGTYTVIEAEVPLSEMFGYANVLRSITQGRGQFQMSFQRYAILPEGLAERMIKDRRGDNKG
ncbi:MAG: EF-Tu/IF-2/RF-3 family GTPase, partial [Desulfatiglandales bacterium]